MSVTDRAARPGPGVDRVFVNSPRTSTVRVVDTTSDTVGDTGWLPTDPNFQGWTPAQQMVASTDGPRTPVFGGDGSLAYITAVHACTVSVTDTATHTALGTFVTDPTASASGPYGPRRLVLIDPDHTTKLKKVIRMTVLVVAAAVFAVVLVLGLIGDGSMNFYAVAEHAATRERDRDAARAAHVRARTARRRHVRSTYAGGGDPHFA